MKAFPIMLKELALDYNYLNISISGIALNFNQVCYSIRYYFEKVEYISDFEQIESGSNQDLDDNNLNDMLYIDILDEMDKTIKGIR